jgi:hypothetical protein
MPTGHVSWPKDVTHAKGSSACPALIRPQRVLPQEMSPEIQGWHRAGTVPWSRLVLLIGSPPGIAERRAGPKTDIPSRADRSERKNPARPDSGPFPHRGPTAVASAAGADGANCGRNRTLGSGRCSAPLPRPPARTAPNRPNRRCEARDMITGGDSFILGRPGRRDRHRQ